MREVFVVHCKAPEEVFVEDYDDIPAELQVAIEDQDGLGCDGGGRPGWWCSGCRWMEREWMEEDELDG